jgi:predicted nucleic acid-binding protein
VIVVDASLAAKLFLDEPGTEAAIALVTAESGRITAPDIFAVEVASTLVREANADKSQAEAMHKKLDAFAVLITHGAICLSRMSASDMHAAANLAINLGHPLKDCIYLALAMELGCDLVTCDAKFAARAKRVWPGVRVLEGEK